VSIDHVTRCASGYAVTSSSDVAAPPSGEMSITDPIIGRAVRRDSRGAASNEPTQPEAKIASRRRKSVRLKQQTCFADPDNFVPISAAIPQKTAVGSETSSENLYSRATWLKKEQNTHNVSK